jgi:uncharacterized protein (TIGR02391 family)
MRVLADFKAGNGWNRDSWIKESQQWGSAKSHAMSRALAEAWAWLEARGLVAWNPEQTSPNAYFVTRLGEEALETGAAKMEAAQRLGMSLHPLIAQTVERQFLLGEYELAVFAAMKQVEITVRDLGGYPNDLLGTKLMQAAFSPSEPGPLADTDTEAGERVATMELFKGAIGLFKNRSSHRAVVYDDPTLSAGVILWADLLLRMLNERLERRGNEESSN